MRNMIDPENLNIPEILDYIKVLEAENAELKISASDEERLRTRLAELLTQTANALHEGPLENGFWSWHDLPQLVHELQNKLKTLESQNENVSTNRS